MTNTNPQQKPPAGVKKVPATPLTRKLSKASAAVIKTEAAWRKALDARDDAIRELHDAQPELSTRAIGQVAGISHEHVARALRGRP